MTIKMHIPILIILSFRLTVQKPIQEPLKVLSENNLAFTC